MSLRKVRPVHLRCNQEPGGRNLFVGDVAEPVAHTMEGPKVDFSGPVRNLRLPSVGGKVTEEAPRSLAALGPLSRRGIKAAAVPVRCLVPPGPLQRAMDVGGGHSHATGIGSRVHCTEDWSQNGDPGGMRGGSRSGSKIGIRIGWNYARMHTTCRSILRVHWSTLEYVMVH